MQSPPRSLRPRRGGDAARGGRRSGGGDALGPREASCGLPFQKLLVKVWQRLLRRWIRLRSKNIPIINLCVCAQAADVSMSASSRW